MADFDVFVSYANKDKAIGEAACAALESQGVRCWIAPRDIHPGTEWGAAIVDAIDRCRVMVLIFSNSANESQQIRREVERAVHVGVPIVPFRIEEITPTKSLAYFLGAVHWLDALTQPVEGHLQHLVDAVRAFLEGSSDIWRDRRSGIASDEQPLQQQPSSSPGTRKPVPTRRIIIAGVTAIALTFSALIAAKLVFPSLFLSPQPPASIAPTPPDLPSPPSDVAGGVPPPTGAPADPLTVEQNVARSPSLTARDIVSRYGDASVMVFFTWRMYDAESGKALFQKVVSDKKTGYSYPAFVRLSNREIVRWLTVDDPERLNIAISGAGTASGFVVGSEGFILTNKHVAAAWMVPFEDVGKGRNEKGLGIVYPLSRKGAQSGEFISLDSQEITVLKRWVPEYGGLVLETAVPRLIGAAVGDGRVTDRRVFRGRNDLLEVRFPGNRVSIQATLVRTSGYADAALIKVESMPGLRAVELAPASEDDKLEIGNRVVVLGFRDVSSDAFIRTTAVGPGRMAARIETVPEPTVTEGIVSLKNAGEVWSAEPVTAHDAYQLSLNSTGTGGSGGPVFNTKGQVIGLLVSPPADGGNPTVVPIKHGRNLLGQGR